MLVHLGLNLWRNDASQLSALVHLDALPVLGAVLLAFVPWLTGATRLWNWSRWDGTPLGWMACLRIVASGEVGAAISPTSFGSASVKSALMVRSGIPLSRAVSIQTMGSVEDAIFFLTVMPVLTLVSGVLDDTLVADATTWLASRRLRLDASLLWIPLAAAVVAILAVRSPWLRRLQDLFRATMFDFRVRVLRAFREHPLVWSTNLALAAIQWLARFSVFGLLLAGFGIEYDALRILVLQWICFTAMGLVPTPGAQGGAELIFLGIFAAEVPPDRLMLAMSAWRMLTFYFLTLVGLMVLQTAEKLFAPTNWSSDVRTGSTRRPR